MDHLHEVVDEVVDEVLDENGDSDAYRDRFRRAVIAAVVSEPASSYPEILVTARLVPISIPDITHRDIAGLPDDRQMDILRNWRFIDIGDVALFSENESLVVNYLMLSEDNFIDWLRIGIGAERCNVDNFVRSNPFHRRLEVLDRIARQKFPQTSPFYDIISLNSHAILSKNYGFIVTRKNARELLAKAMTLWDSIPYKILSTLIISLTFTEQRDDDMRFLIYNIGFFMSGAKIEKIKHDIEVSNSPASPRIYVSLMDTVVSYAIQRDILETHFYGTQDDIRDAMHLFRQKIRELQSLGNLPVTGQ